MWPRPMSPVLKPLIGRAGWKGCWLTGRPQKTSVGMPLGSTHVKRSTTRRSSASPRVPGVHLDAAVLQLLGDALEGGRIGHLPADELEVVAAVRTQLHTVVAL